MKFNKKKKRNEMSKYKVSVGVWSKRILRDLFMQSKIFIIVVWEILRWKIDDFSAI